MLKTSLLEQISNLHHGLAILVDPDKFISLENKKEWIKRVNFLNPDYIFIGGSIVSKKDFDCCIETLKEYTTVPIVIFPGNYDQIHADADALLFLSLLSGQNPEYLINQHIKAVELLENIYLEIIPTAYLLIDGGIQTAVQYVSQTQPIPRNAKSIAYKIALAGKYQGKKLIYLDAGSGAKNSVPNEMIAEVIKIGLPLIVGGGIRSVEQIKACYDSGANLVVIGNKLEEDMDFILDLVNYKSNISIKALPSD